MLTKEEYLSIIEDFEGIFFEMEIVYNFQDIQKLKDLIKEHFELVEHAKKLQNEVDYYKHEYFSMCDLIENPQPYKFEELKKGMWVWMVWFKEGAEKGRCAKILYTYTTPPYYYNDEDGEEHKRVGFRIGDGSGAVDFDAWKFYPPTKAMEYQK